MRPFTPVSAAAAALMTLAGPLFFTAQVPPEHVAGRSADIPTTTRVLEDDFLTLFPSIDRLQEDYFAGDNMESQVNLPGTGTHAVTWGSLALAVAATGAIVTANSRSRRPRRPRSDARSGPAA